MAFSTRAKSFGEKAIRLVWPFKKPTNRQGWFDRRVAALGSDHGKDTPDERCGNRPACAREEAHTEPDEDQLEVNGRRHGGFSRYNENR